MSATTDMDLLLLRLGFMEGLALAAIANLKQKGHLRDADALEKRREEFNTQFKHPLAREKPE